MHTAPSPTRPGGGAGMTELDDGLPPTDSYEDREFQRTIADMRCQELGGRKKEIPRAGCGRDSCGRFRPTGGGPCPEPTNLGRARPASPGCESGTTNVRIGKHEVRRLRIVCEDSPSGRLIRKTARRSRGPFHHGFEPALLGYLRPGSSRGASISQSERPWGRMPQQQTASSLGELRMSRETTRPAKCGGPANAA